MDPNFDVEYLDEATQFILSLPIKVREKVLYNITKSGNAWNPKENTKDSS